MPLHDYLEQKRREQIPQLNADGACHICGSNCRSAIGFHRHVLGKGDQPFHYNDNSMIQPPIRAAMRTCSCFGIPVTDPAHCPYSLRVCDRCIEDDRGIGRIRTCGVCGIVACDEYCGPELLECTDSPDWNNAGCLECRRMGDFSEISIFKSPFDEANETRMTRICIKCLEQSTLWTTHHFVCRRFHCETKLVPSDFVERKRLNNFGSSPLNLIPEDGLVMVVDFLSESDLRNIFFTCTAMCKVSERVAMKRVMSVNDILPTGPIIFENKNIPKQKRQQEVMRLEGSNSFGLRVPDDAKTWLGLYHFVEKFAMDKFYFSFQMDGRSEDRDAVGRFLNRKREEKFSFEDNFYHPIRANEEFVEQLTTGLSVRGGTVLVTTGESVSPLVFVSDQKLSLGTCRVICKVSFPEKNKNEAHHHRHAAAQRNEAHLHRDDVARHNEPRVGSIGIMISNDRGDLTKTKWARRRDVFKEIVKENEVVFGLQVVYGSERCSMTVINNIDTHLPSTRDEVEATSEDQLYIAIELTSAVVNESETLLTCRYCSEEEWQKLMDHKNSIADEGDEFLDRLRRRLAR